MTRTFKGAEMLSQEEITVAFAMSIISGQVAKSTRKKVRAFETIDGQTTGKAFGLIDADYLADLAKEDDFFLYKAWVQTTDLGWVGKSYQVIIEDSKGEGFLVDII